MNLLGKVNVPFALLPTSTEVRAVVATHVKLRFVDIKHVMILT